jgi:hypothetical protein
LHLLHLLLWRMLEIKLRWGEQKALLLLRPTSTRATVTPPGGAAACAAHRLRWHVCERGSREQSCRTLQRFVERIFSGER